MKGALVQAPIFKDASMNLLDQFQFPAVAQEEFISKGLTARMLSNSGGGQAISFEMSGHDKGIAYRFFLHKEKNQVKSDEFDLEINDEIEMIQWIKDKNFKPVERVRFLPPELLRFNKKGECVGGQYAEAYKAWKAGRASAGLMLSQWPRASIGQVGTLNSEGIFTVEQFAATPKDRIQGRFPEAFVELHKDAVQFVNSMKPIEDVKKYADQVLILSQEKAKMLERMQSLEDRLLELAKKPVKKPRGRPCKVIEEPKSYDGFNIEGDK